MVQRYPGKILVMNIIYNMIKEIDKFQDEDAVKSRSQIKREMIQLQKTGEQLVGFSLDQIKSIDMPEYFDLYALSPNNKRRS
jgi:ribosomal 50S subunit-associated protein YjgA (DUF615 family)